MEDGRPLTGRSTDIPCFREGKVTRLNHWLEETGTTWRTATSIATRWNDLPLLEQVTHPVAGIRIRIYGLEAEKRGWPVITSARLKDRSVARVGMHH